MIRRNSPIPDIISGFFSVLSRNLRTWKKSLLSDLLGYLAESLFWILGLGIVLEQWTHKMKGEATLEFIGPGLVVISAILSAAIEGTFGAHSRLFSNPVMKSLLATPLGFIEIVGGEIFFAACKGTIAGTCVILVLILFGLSPTLWIALSVPLLVVCGVLSAGFSLLATVLIRNPHTLRYYFSLLLFPLILFSGIFFPFQDSLQRFSALIWLNPLFHANQIMQNLFGTDAGFYFIGDWIWLIITSGLPWVPLVVLLRRRIQYIS